MSDTLIAPGTTAPDFVLPGSPEQQVRLSSLRGKPVILAFYPADFSPVCGDQFSIYQEVKPEITEKGVELVGISVDGPYAHHNGAAQVSANADGSSLFTWTADLLPDELAAPTEEMMKQGIAVIRETLGAIPPQR